MNILTHRWDIRQGEVIKNRTRKHERKYVDFIVSGEPLSEIFQTQQEMITMFGWTTNLDYEKRTIKEFLKREKAELGSGRTIIYGCAECGDIGCGAITAEIVDLDDKIIWQNFGYENNYDELRLEEYKHIGPFEFGKQEYTNEFQNILAELEITPRKADEIS